MLTTVSVDKFRKIYRQQFGVELSREEAAEQAQRFLNLSRIILQPIPKRYEARYSELVIEQGKTTNVSD